jgi:hypothetical protein
MNDADLRLIDKVRDLHRELDSDLVRLLHSQRNPDQFTEHLRDLGQHLHDLGTDLLTRVADLDAQYEAELIRADICRTVADIRSSLALTADELRKEATYGRLPATLVDRLASRLTVLAARMEAKSEVSRTTQQPE